jgi:hypothetical protein
VKLKVIFVSLAIAVVPITPLNAQSVSPTGHYAKKRGGAGEMRVEKIGEGWQVFVGAGGIPKGAATAADCTLISVGEIKGNTFQGENTASIQVMTSQVRTTQSSPGTK